MQDTWSPGIWWGHPATINLACNYFFIKGLAQWLLASPSITIPPPQLCPSCRRHPEWFTLQTERKGVGGTHAHSEPLAWCRKWATLEQTRTRVASQNASVEKKKIEGAVRNPYPKGTNEALFFSSTLEEKKKGIPRATGREVRIRD